MTSGSSVHQKIKGRIKEAESKAEELASQLYQVEQDLTHLTAEREGCYGSLAVHYLPELDAQAVQTTLRDVREGVERIFREKQERRGILEKLMKENRRENSKLELEVDETTAQIEKLAQERDKIVKLIYDDLQKDTSYIQSDGEAKKAEVRLQQYRKRVDEIEKGAREKLPAFEQNAIFSYLLRTGYGTEQYTRSGLRKMLDSWAAEKVDFRENKTCYDFLKSMPEMMRQEVARRQEELDQIVSGMREIESRVGKQHGLPKIIAQAEGLISQRKALIEKDKKQNGQYAAYITEREDIDGKKDPYHVQAVQQIKKFLKGEQIAALMSIARQTKSTEDDKTVERIGEIDSRIRVLKDSAKNVRSERDDISKKLDGLRGIEQRFIENDYEGSYSSFSSGFDIDTLLMGYMLGRITSSYVNNQIDSSQHTRTPSYHPSSSYSSSYHSRDNIIGDTGIFSSGTGIDVGGFSSGSGF